MILIERPTAADDRSRAPQAIELGGPHQPFREARPTRKKALQDQQQGPAWNNKRMCAALVCVAIWTYAIIYFATLYSYRLEAVRLRRVIRGA